MRLFADLAMTLQRATDARVVKWAASAGESELQQVVWLEAEHFRVAAYAGEVASCLLNNLVGERPSAAAEFASDLADLLDYAEPRMLDPNARLLMAAARQRGLLVIDEDNFFEPDRQSHAVPHGLIHVGMGRAGHRYIGTLAEGLPPETCDRVRRLSLLMPALRSAGVPVPRHDIEFPNTRTWGRVERAAARLGYPVTLRAEMTPECSYAVPDLAVVGPITSPSQLERAYRGVFARNPAVWVEAHVPGEGYSFLIVDGRVESVIVLRPPQVQGDGNSSLRQLVRRRVDAASSLQERKAWKSNGALSADVEAMLALSNLGWESVPEPGMTVDLRARGSAGNGGRCADVTDAIAPAFKEIALFAARACSLAVAGVEMVIQDLHGAADDRNCAVMNVVLDPDFAMHDSARAGTGTAAAQWLLRHRFPNDADARIPVVAITGTNGKTTTTRLVAHIFRQTGLRVGLACSHGAYVDNHCIVSGDMSGAPGSSAVLANPRVDAAVLEAARGGLIKFGRPFTTCDVGVCLNVAADHIGVDGVRDLDQMAAVKRQVVENTSGTAVLNADDPRCLAMIPYSSARRLLLFSGNPHSQAMLDHVRAGDDAVVVEDSESGEFVVVQAGSDRHRVIAVREIPLTGGGRARYNVDNAVAAAAAAYAAGIPLPAIAEGLRSFQSDLEHNPGRFNEIPGLPFRLLLDSAHNPHGIDALTRRLAYDHCPGRRIAVLGLSHAPSDEDKNAFVQIAARSFDHFICTLRKDLDSAASKRMPQVLREKLLECDIPESGIAVIPSRTDAINAALAMARPGDWVVVFVAAADPTVIAIGDKLRRLAAGSEYRI